MHRHEIDRLDATRTYWVPAVTSPVRNWPAVPGCRRGARFLVDAETFHASREEFDTFETQLGCLQWIMRHRIELNQALPGATIRAVRLDQWLLGMA